MASLGLKFLLAAATLLAAASSFAQTQSNNTPEKSSMNTPEVRPAAKTGFAAVDGLKLYYEVHGQRAAGQVPLLLVHGGVGAFEMFGPLLPALAAQRQVIVVDLQGHGRTADTERPFSLEAMGDDLAALLKQLDVPKADVLGYSLGGGAALRTVLRHPDLVRRLVLVSTPFKRSAWYPEVRSSFDQMKPETGAMMAQSPLAKMYPAVDWQRLFGKLGELMRRDYDLTQEIARIKAPTLLVFADADAVPASHMADFYKLLGGAQKDGGMDGSGRPASQLAVLPGFTHYNLLSSPLLQPAVEAFLNTP
jgi:pimeloyl-ACP methyl ester carboxylesterase